MGRPKPPACRNGLSSWSKTLKAGDASCWAHNFGLSLAQILGSCDSFRPQLRVHVEAL
jgi:hypothetical protein